MDLVRLDDEAPLFDWVAAFLLGRGRGRALVAVPGPGPLARLRDLAGQPGSGPFDVRAGDRLVHLTCGVPRGVHADAAVLYMPRLFDAHARHYWAGVLGVDPADISPPV